MRTRSDDSLGMYLNDIGQVSLLTADEEKELARTIEHGRYMTGLQQTAQTLGGLALQEARDFITLWSDAELDETDAEARNKSPYLRQLTDLVKVADRPVLADIATRRAAEGKDRFIRSNLRLVVSIARRYPTSAGLDLKDMIQEGSLGLEHAVDKFDWQRGFKFSTYATFWIRQAIGRALDQKESLIRLPGDKSSGLRAALRASVTENKSLDQENTRLHELANPVSLDMPVGEGDTSLGEIMACYQEDFDPEATVMKNVEREILDELLSTLDDRARYAVEARFGLFDGERKSFREIGEQLGVTAEAARRLINRAVAGLRDDAERILEV